MSEHKISVIEIAEVRPHSNADALEIIPIGGWQAVAKKGQFKAGDRAIYIEPDYVVPTGQPEFAFLAKDGKAAHRLRAIRLRGALSFGLLIPVPERLSDRAVGTDVMADLGIQRYVPPTKPFRGGSDGHELPSDQWPNVYAPKFDIESLANWPDVFQAGEPVVVTEKIDGANAGYVWHNGQIYMRSRSRWLKPDADHFWSRAATPQLIGLCKSLPDHIVFGEVFGPVQSLKYGRSEPAFIMFAVLSPTGEWANAQKLQNWSVRADVRMVPVFYEGPFDLESIKAIAEHDSAVGPTGHLMEGIVITPFRERRDDRLGRVALKHISTRFWLSDA